jgi:hypothetical protein
LAFSFNSDEIWDEPFFSLRCDEFEGNHLKVNNVTTREHWNVHFEQISDERKGQALNSDDIEKWIDGEFPHVIFTSGASKQLKSEDSQLFLSEIWDACKELNEVIERACSVVSYQYVIRKTNLEITDESSTVKNSSKLNRYRSFTYNGGPCFFYYHIKNFSGKKRVHFIIDDNKIVIGYLGKHLRL